MFRLPDEMVCKTIVEHIDDLKDLLMFGRTNRRNKRIVDDFITQVLPTSKGAKWIIAQFEKYISSDSKKCLGLTTWLQKLGIVKSWEKQVNNDPFILIAFLLTTENISREPLPVREDGFKSLNMKLDEAIKSTGISCALAASMKFAYQIRHYPVWEPDFRGFVINLTLHMTHL